MDNNVGLTMEVGGRLDEEGKKEKIETSATT